jgi:hypothetical protein
MLPEDGIELLSSIDKFSRARESMRLSVSLTLEGAECLILISFLEEVELLLDFRPSFSLLALIVSLAFFSRLATKFLRRIAIFSH